MMCLDFKLYGKGEPGVGENKMADQRVFATSPKGKKIIGTL